MSCDSVAYLKGFIEPKRIVDYIKNNRKLPLIVQI